MFSRLGFWDPYMIANPTLPKLYWEVKSSEQLIANLYCILNSLSDYVNENTTVTNELEAAVEELRELFDRFQASGFDDYYRAQIADWIAANGSYIWSTVGRQVFFGLTDDGYFCAYVPESWSDIVFDTGAVFGSEQYGRLILRYDTSGSGVIDNTSPTYPAPDASEELQSLRMDVNELRSTVYTALMQQEVG